VRGRAAAAALVLELGTHCKLNTLLQLHLAVAGVCLGGMEAAVLLVSPSGPMTASAGEQQPTDQAGQWLNDHG